MVSIDTILAALTDTQIAREVGNLHDDTRMGYRPPANRVESFADFEDLLAGYYAYHFSRAVAEGARIPRMHALDKGKELVERHYRRQRRGDLVAAYHDVADGVNGGKRAVLDAIADEMKQEATEAYVRHVFDSMIAPVDHAQRTELIRQFMSRYGRFLSIDLQNTSPEHFSHNYVELVRGYAEGITRAASVFRRL